MLVDDEQVAIQLSLACLPLQHGQYEALIKLANDLHHLELFAAEYGQQLFAVHLDVVQCFLLQFLLELFKVLNFLRVFFYEILAKHRVVQDLGVLVAQQALPLVCQRQVYLDFLWCISQKARVRATIIILAAILVFLVLMLGSPLYFNNLSIVTVNAIHHFTEAAQHRYRLFLLLLVLWSFFFGLLIQVRQHLNLLIFLISINVLVHLHRNLRHLFLFVLEVAQLRVDLDLVVAREDARILLLHLLVVVAQYLVYFVRVFARATLRDEHGSFGQAVGLPALHIQRILDFLKLLDELRLFVDEVLVARDAVVFFARASFTTLLLA